MNGEYEGVCKTDSYYVDPVKLYPGDACIEGDYAERCVYGLQTYNTFNKIYYSCSNSTCVSVGTDGDCA